MYYESALLLFTRKLHYLKHFERSLHIKSSNPACVQNFRPLPLMVFEILVFNLKNKNNNNDKKNWRNGLFAIYPMLVVQLSNSYQILGAHTY